MNIRGNISLKKMQKYLSMDYFITITIPEKQYRKIWDKYYPNSIAIFHEYMFMLHDTYGLALRTIQEVFDKVSEIQSNGDKIILRYPKNWKTK